MPFKNENYFTLDKLSKYRHITLKFVGKYIYLVFQKNRAILVQKLGEEIFFSKSLSGYFMTKKKERKKSSMTIKPEREGEGPARLLKEIFLQLPYNKPSR